MLVAKLIAENYPRPNERDLREASELLDEPVENILRVERYNHTESICTIYFVEPVKVSIDGEPFYIVEMAISRSGYPTKVKDTKNHWYAVL